MKTKIEVTYVHVTNVEVFFLLKQELLLIIRKRKLKFSEHMKERRHREFITHIEDQRNRKKQWENLFDNISK